jgi:hypothetical protein
MPLKVYYWRLRAKALSSQWQISGEVISMATMMDRRQFLQSGAAPRICSQAVCRVPMLWYASGVTAKGLVSHQFVEKFDIAPTLLSLCGLPALDTADGRDLTPLPKDEDKPVRDAAATENVWSKALRWGPYRFVHYPKALFGRDVGEMYNLEKIRTRPGIFITMRLRKPWFQSAGSCCWSG